MPKNDFPLQGPLVITQGPQNLEIHTLKNVEGVAADERKFWTRMEKRVAAPSSGDFPRQLHLGWQLLENSVVAGDAGYTQLANAFARAAVNCYNRGVSYLRNSREATDIDRLVADGGHEEAWQRLQAISSGRSAPDLPHPHLSPTEFLAELSSDTAQHLASIREHEHKANELISMLEGRAAKAKETEDRIENFDSVLNGYRSEIDKLYEDTTLDLETIKTNAQAEATLPTPAKFWGTRRDEHRKQEEIWGGVFVGSLIASIILLAGFWDVIERIALPIAHLAKDNPSGGYLVGLLFLGLPVFLYIWLLRLCFRAYVLNRELANDASERIVMMETYVELAKGQHVSREDFHLALRALFRNHTASSADDAPPTLVEAISQQLRKGSN